MQKRMLAVPDDLPTKKAVDSTMAYEAAEKSTCKLNTLDRISL